MARITFLGDIMFGNKRVRIDPRLINILGESNIVIGNLEGPITNTLPRKARDQPLATNPAIADLLEDLHLSIAILANNHIMDHGPEGLVNTQMHLNEVGIKCVGAGVDSYEACKPLIIQCSSVRVGVLAFCYDEGPMAGPNSPGPCPLPSRGDIRRRILELRQNADFVVVSCHGGEEFFTVPWPRRRELFLDIARGGADIVFGHHSHVVQGFEKAGQTLIIYGAGNFYLDIPYMHSHPLTDKGALFNVQIDHSSLGLSLTPVYTDRIRHYVGIAEGKEAEQIKTLINYSSSCLEKRNLYVKEWRQQSFRRIVGDGGLLRKTYRFLRFLRTTKYCSHRLNSWFLKRDHDIISGALEYMPRRLLCMIIRKKGARCSTKHFSS
jgi:hypothetical protein